MRDLLTCTACKIKKPRTDFYKIRKGHHGVQSPCKDCKKALVNTKALNRKATLNLRNLTPELYDSMLKSQEFGCAICKSKIGHFTHKGEPAHLAVDHNHKTEEVRGLLCGKCNRGLGWFNDNPELLRSAALYLDNFQRAI